MTTLPPTYSSASKRFHGAGGRFVKNGHALAEWAVYRLTMDVLHQAMVEAVKAAVAHQGIKDAFRVERHIGGEGRVRQGPTKRAQRELGQATRFGFTNGRHETRR